MVCVVWGEVCVVVSGRGVHVVDGDDDEKEDVENDTTPLCKRVVPLCTSLLYAYIHMYHHTLTHLVPPHPHTPS